MPRNTTVELAVEAAARSGAPVHLLLEDVQRAADSFAIRVFIDQPEADADTPVEGNARYAGTVYLYGHGQLDPSRERFPERAVRQRTPYDQVLDVTDQLRSLEAERETVAVTLVAVDLQNRPLDPERIEIRRLALVPGE